MKAEITFPKSASVAMLKEASVGKSFVFKGHTTSCTSPFFRAGFKFNTNRVWIVLLGSVSPVPATIVTIAELPEEGYGLHEDDPK